MALLFLLGCVFFPLCFVVLRWGLQNRTSLRMERQEAVLVASKVSYVFLTSLGFLPGFCCIDRVVLEAPGLCLLCLLCTPGLCLLCLLSPLSLDFPEVKQT
ncbi:mCG22389, isoform CRA_a [Mus musculus]|nr:mCG22389, isoform CRA_a [Mus musculus]